MIDDAQNKVVDDINAVNEFLENYHSYVPPLSGGPQTAYEMLMEKMESAKTSINELTTLMSAENPPGVKNPPK